MSEKKNEITKPESFANLAPIAGEVQINQDHVVSLMVSQAEESLVAKERDIQNALTTTNTKLTESRKALDDMIAEESKAKEKQLSDLDFGSLKQVGVDNITLSVRLYRKDSDNSMYFEVSGSHEPNKKSKDEVRSRSFSLQSTIPFTPPNKMKAMFEDIRLLEAEISELKGRLIELRAYRQNELGSLERWAKGQIAKHVFKTVGGDHEKFAQTMADSMPESLKSLLG